MRKLAFVAALFAAGCGSSAPDPTSAPAVAPRDAQLAALQTSLTELLERMDVMNDRIARLEIAATSSAAPVSRSAAPVSAPARAGAVAGAPSEREQPSQPQRALVGASIAEQYRNAIALFAQNRHRDSRAIFQQVFDADPSGDLADNALFWIGETYYAAADYPNAMTYYRRVSEEFGDQNKAPDALFKLALAHEKTGDLVLARQTLQSVISRYPYSSPASAARGELNRIKY